MFLNCLWILLLNLWGLHEIICKINIRWKVIFECHSSHVTKHNTEQIRVIFQFLIPRWLRWREVLQCASLPRCNPGTTCRWPGHRAFPAAPLGNGRSDSGYTGISTKRKHDQSDSVYIVNYKSFINSTECLEATTISFSGPFLQKFIVLLIWKTES